MSTHSIDKTYVNGLKEALDKAYRDNQEFFVFNGADYFRDYAKYFIEYASQELNGRKALFRNGEAIIVHPHGTWGKPQHGKVTGYVGFHPNRMQVRVEYDSGDVVDYDQFKLFSIVEGAQLPL
jgi:hypothetical protein